MKILVIINESFGKMILGKNTTLSYILAAFELGYETYIYDFSKDKKFPNKIVSAFKLDKKSGESLTSAYKGINQEIVDYIKKNDYENLVKMPLIRVNEFIKDLEEEDLLIEDVKVVLQRMEPMKSPFPPEGNKNIDDVLDEIRKTFALNIIFNCPIGLYDKEIPQKINQILQSQNKLLIATKTEEIKLTDDDFSQALEKIRKEYKVIFNNGLEKIVLKPKNSAQAFGVFAIEFCQNGFDLSSLERQEIAELSKSQIYKISNNLDSSSLKEVIEILCFVQRVKSNSDLLSKLGKNIIANILHSQIIKSALELYNEEILIQPFLEGVKSGDIRLNYLKNNNGDFYPAGATFRSSLRKDGNNFTTAYINGGATSKPLTALNEEEEEDILNKSEIILKILNQDLRDKYKNSLELGADFILTGDGKTAFLGEINHHCQGLIPVSEAMEKSINDNAIYDGGLGLTKVAISDLIKMQKRL